MTETIGQHMTTCPHSVGAEQPLDRAIDAMRKFGVRHMPVLHGGELVGMLSDRDIALLEGLTEEARETLTVEDVMSPEPYAVTRETPLAVVLRGMERRHVGSAVVLDAESHITGIYTSTDAVRMLADRLNAPPNR